MLVLVQVYALFSQDERQKWMSVSDKVNLKLNFDAEPEVINKVYFLFYVQDCSDLIMKTAWDGDHDAAVRTNKRFTGEN